MSSQRIDLVVFHNFYLLEEHTYMFNRSMSRIAEYLGVKYSSQNRQESDLDLNPQDRKVFPEEGIIYVHGNHWGYGNLDKVVKLSPQRPDLKFIVKIDSDARRDQFSSSQMYDTYRELLGFREVLTSPILVRDTKVIKHDGDISLVLDSPSSEAPTPFQQYLSLLLESRRGAQ